MKTEEEVVREAQQAAADSYATRWKAEVDALKVIMLATVAAPMIDMGVPKEEAFERGVTLLVDAQSWLIKKGHIKPVRQ